jgi:hypothetical protein
MQGAKRARYKTYRTITPHSEEWIEGKRKEKD